ncbi:N-acetyltransferase ESCO2 [Nilaparvata lugens]|uniref:N-acetyltransferase ESCO2 n=1 Tax=Nilaparvata lugens TaxID=108931 RepID=UPI00193E11D2|nr:N-acetyltransferase ESCO2 [Nilaparvata lugens]XP_022192899.2 N-acetyltransferase ESCO2 [Nilaparvata lugens]
METAFRTPDKGAKSAPAKVLLSKSDVMSVSSRKCLFPDNSWRSKKVSDDDDDMNKPTVIDTYLKPSSFYGNSAPITKTDFPKVSRPLPDASYKSRVRLFHDGSLKRKRSIGGGRRSLGSLKRPKNEIYTGVSHSIKPRKPVVANGKRRSSSATRDSPGGSSSDVSPTRSSPGTQSDKQFESPSKTDNILFRDSLVYTTRKTPRSMKKSSSSSKNSWSMKFTKARREEVSEGEGESGKKRKFFKSTGKSPISPYNVILPEKTKRRKLLSNTQDEVNMYKHLGTASDILDLIEDGRVLEEHDEQRTEDVSKLIGQLADENDENMPIDNLLDITQNTNNLSITDSPQSNLNTPQKILGVTPLGSSPRRSPRIRTPTKLFSIFDKSSPRFTDISNMTSAGKSPSKGKRSPVKTPAKLRPISSDQLQIDVGQKKLGEKVCPTCSLVYQMGDPDDELQHEKYHNNHALFKFLGWQNERVIRRYRMDRVVLVLPADQKAWWDRVKGLLQVIDTELGYLPEELHPELQFLMYVSNKKIIGCLAALPVNKAYKMLMSESDIDMCSEESYPVKCAVSRVWTHKNFRKSGIASKLMDCLRSSFLPGEYLQVDDVAFSVPTVDGRIFAQKYTKREDYLVYTGW